jgi:tetratricopeptide (TPR) repeat protein
MEAADLYEHALQLGAVDALIHFNHAIALEDQRDTRGAVESYRRALALDPDLADAHYNIARLLEKQGDPQGALRHFSAYRRLAR